MKQKKHQHICIFQHGIYLLHVIFLHTDAPSFYMTVLTGHTPTNLLPAHIHHINLMPCGHSPFLKRINHPSCVSLFPWASV